MKKGTKRKRHSEETKHAVLEAYANRGDKPVAAILAEHGISSSELSRWRNSPALKKAAKASRVSKLRDRLQTAKASARAVARGATHVALGAPLATDANQYLTNLRAELDAALTQNRQLRATLKTLL
jgi:transposase-like protein